VGAGAGRRRAHEAGLRLGNVPPRMARVHDARGARPSSESTDVSLTSPRADSRVVATATKEAANVSSACTKDGLWARLEDSDLKAGIDAYFREKKAAK